MTDGYVKFHEYGQGSTLIQLAKQYPPRSAIREFVTNSLDARIPELKEKNIAVIINPYERRIIISDNGTGIQYEKFSDLPVSIGYSQKAELQKKGHIDIRGEKGLGLLAFGSMGDVMHIITRYYKDNNAAYNYMRWEMDADNQRISYENHGIDSRVMEENFGGNFPHGTRIIIDRANPHVIDKILTIPNLREWLRLLYNPAIRKGEVNIYLGKSHKQDKRIIPELLEPIEYGKALSTKLMDETLDIKIKNEGLPGRLEVLLYVNPEGVFDKVGVYSKDVLVYEVLSELTEFNKNPIWAPGKVSGYFNDFFNKLILGREGIDRNRKVFKAWFNTISEIGEKIRPVIEKNKGHGKRIKEKTYIKMAYDAVLEALKEIGLTERAERYSRSKDGEQISVMGVSPLDEEGKEALEDIDKDEKHTGTIRKPVRDKYRQPGPGTFVEDEEGYKEDAKPKRRIPFECPASYDFPFEERKLRSKMETSLDSPLLVLNSGHEDYKLRSEQKDRTIFVRYVVDLISKEAAFNEIKKAEKEKKLLEGKVETADSALRRAEEIKFIALKRAGMK